ncbi:MAG: hypothetical protein K8R35_00045 [Bacteroidales bacterium]|nr:hypothetical protein [Bacteroidales bacterium]
MRKSLYLIIVTLVFAGLMISCKNRKSEIKGPEITYAFNTADSVKSDIPDEKKEIFYGLLTPIEIGEIFTRLGALYSPEILNDDDNADDYLSSSKAALNLGVYGVDLSYLKMFNMTSEMVQYMITVRSLSSKLSIPIEYLTDPINKMESNMGDADSVLLFVNDAYMRIEDHLKIDGRESTAGLMVLGGWIEALYIATEMLLDTENPDPEIIARIAEQKYTLNTLLSFLKNYYDDPIVVYYTKKLKFLKKYFDQFNIYFFKEDLEIDKERQILKASKSEMTITLDNLNNIKEYVRGLRAETVGI